MEVQSRYWHGVHARLAVQIPNKIVEQLPREHEATSSSCLLAQNVIFHATQYENVLLLHVPVLFLPLGFASFRFHAVYIHLMSKLHRLMPQLSLNHAETFRVVTPR